jgi:hypothetical protein
LPIRSIQARLHYAANEWPAGKRNTRRIEGFSIIWAVDVRLLRSSGVVVMRDVEETRIELVAFDPGGTIVDHGGRAPVDAFVNAFGCKLRSHDEYHPAPNTHE